MLRFMKFGLKELREAFFSSDERLERFSAGQNNTGISVMRGNGSLCCSLMLRTTVTPAKAGTDNILKILDSGLSRNDGETE